MSRKIPRAEMRTIHFVSLGCPKNRVDTEVIAGRAAALGLVPTARPELADVIVVNSCAFVESAREESVDTVLELARHRTAGRCRLLVVAGCLAQRHGEELAAEIPEIDHLLGTAFPEGIDQVLEGTATRLQRGPPGHFLQGADTPRLVESGAKSTYVKIADGCSRRCAFCAIPAIKGQARSRPIADIVAEATRLAAQGVVELNLVAQDTSAYGRDLPGDTDLAQLLAALDKVPDLAWIRLLYLYPDAVDKRLLEAMRELERVVPYLDVPVQHASAKMLRRMRRGHGPGALRRLVGQARRILPSVFLRTTVLVGHPGEEDDDFTALVEFVEQSRFQHLGAFRYSDEEGTASFGSGPRVRPRDSYNRLRRILASQKRISRAHNQALVGREVELLVEGVADQDGFVLCGRHAGQAPEVDGVTYLVSSSARPGEMLRARVVKSSDYDIVVEPL